MEQERQATRWENTILGNTHRLKRLAEIDPLAEKLEVKIHITRNALRKGVHPIPLNHRTIEFKQGDSISGYFTVLNKCSVPLPFDMLSVVLEGKVTVVGDSADPKRPLLFYKFLNMFDYNALWTPAQVSAADAGFDESDKTMLSFPMEKFFAPGVTYKKFFNFTLPEKLLDCACETHDLALHCELFPTIGMTREEFLQNLRLMREREWSKSGSGMSPSLSLMTRSNSPNSLHSLMASSNGGFVQDLADVHGKRKPTGFLQPRIKDVCFADSAVSYSIEVRVVGKSTDYWQLTNCKHKALSEHEEFVIVQNTSCFLRVIPRQRLLLDSPEYLVESKLIYKNLINRIDEKLAIGRDLLDGKTPDTTMRLKTNQSRNRSETRVKGSHEAWFPYKKKTLTGGPKVVGMIGIRTPIETLRMPYIPLASFLNGTKLTEKLCVPVELTYNSTAALLKPPEIKSVHAELLVITYRSKKYPIPIEITNDMIYTNEPREEDDGLDAHVVKPMKKKLAELADHMTRFGSETIRAETQLVMDMKALAKLQVKIVPIRFAVALVKLSETPVLNWPPASSQKYTKTMQLVMDWRFKDMSDDLALVPNCQNCIMGRMYFVNVVVKFASESVSLKVPLHIERL